MVHVALQSRMSFQKTSNEELVITTVFPEGHPRRDSGKSLQGPELGHLTFLL